MVRVHDQVMRRSLWKCKRMFRISFRPLPTVLPRGNSLLPLKIQTHPRRDCSLSFGKPLAFPSCPSSTLLLPLSSAGSLDCFPVWTVPGRKRLGEQRACWPSFFFSGEARLIQLHWQVVFPRRVAKHVGPLLRELRQHSVMEKPSLFLQNHQRRPGQTPGLFFFFNQPQEPPKQLPKLCQQLPLEIQILQPAQGQLCIPGGAPQNYATGMWYTYAWEHLPLDLD